MAGVLPCDSRVATQGGDKRDEHALADRDPAGTGGNRHQSYHRADGCTQSRGLMATQTVENHPRDHGDGSSGVSVEKRQDGNPVGGQRAAAIESEPSEPQHGCPEKHKRHIGRLGTGGGRATAKEQGPGESSHTRGRMYHYPSGEVMDMHQGEEPLGMPGAMGQRTVDKDDPENHEEQVARETHSLGKRASDERRGDDGKLHLEQGEQRQGNRGGGETNLIQPLHSHTLTLGGRHV